MKPHAHHDGAASGAGFGLDRVGLGHLPQVVDAGQLGAADLQPPVPGSRRDERLLILELPA
jgi:hypothetical protein